MKGLGRFFLLGTIGLIVHGTAHAQAVAPSCNLSGCTISSPGSYILNGNISGLTISANNVVLNLSGFTVTQNPTGSVACTIAQGTRGNSCTTTPNGSPAISVTGSNVTITNGVVSSGRGIGILVTSSFNANSNLTLKDIKIANFIGTGIDISNADVISLIDVQSNQNGGFGILGTNGVALLNVTTNYNNNSGIQLNSGVLENVTASFNKGAGIVSAGTISKAKVQSNGATGIIGAAVIRDAYALQNVGDGFFVGSWGVVTNSISVSNGVAMGSR